MQERASAARGQFRSDRRRLADHLYRRDSYSNHRTHQFQLGCFRDEQAAGSQEASGQFVATGSPTSKAKLGALFSPFFSRAILVISVDISVAKYRQARGAAG